ncbi:MAG: hypothetical protein AAGF26_16785 [Cyanobacteria bacterium P01_G01_bin.49]
MSQGIQHQTFRQRAQTGKYIAWGLTGFDAYMTHLYLANLVKTGTYVNFYLFKLSANTVIGILGAAFISLYQLTIISMLFNPSFFAKVASAPKQILSSLSPDAAKLYRVVLYSGLAVLAFGFFKICQINLQGTVTMLGTGDNEFARFLSVLIMISGEVALHLAFMNELMAGDEKNTSNGGLKL